MLFVANLLVLSYLSDLYLQGTELERVMVARTAEIEFSILSLDVFLRAALVRVVERLPFDCMIASCTFRVAIWLVPFRLIKEWVL